MNEIKYNNFKYNLNIKNQKGFGFKMYDFEKQSFYLWALDKKVSKEDIDKILLESDNIDDAQEKILKLKTQSSDSQSDNQSKKKRKRRIKKKPSDNQSFDKQSSDKQSSDDQSSDNQSSDNQSSDNQSSDNQSSDNQSSDNQSKKKRKRKNKSKSDLHKSLEKKKNIIFTKKSDNLYIYNLPSKKKPTYSSKLVWQILSEFSLIFNQKEQAWVTSLDNFDELIKKFTELQKKLKDSPKPSDKHIPKSIGKHSPKPSGKDTSKPS